MAAASRRHDLRHRRGRLRPRRGRRPPRAAHQLRPRLPAGKADEEGGGGIHQRYGTQKCIQFLLSRRRGAREAWALGVTLGLSGGGGSVYGAPDKSRPPALPESRLRRARQKKDLTLSTNFVRHVFYRRKCSLKFGSYRPRPSVRRSVTRQLRDFFILPLPSLCLPLSIILPLLPSPISFSSRRLSTAPSLPPYLLPSTISFPLPSSSLPFTFHGRRTSAVGPSAGRAARPAALLLPTPAPPASKGGQKTRPMRKEGQ